MTETREGTDVVERLTFTTRPVGDIIMLDFRSGGCRPASDVEIECLAEITRLRAESEALKEALRTITLMSKEHEHDLFSATQVARAALKETDNG
jgi:coenzyme F420-reducing hydrogenase gamma subunit